MNQPEVAELIAKIGEFDGFIKRTGRHSLPGLTHLFLAGESERERVASYVPPKPKIKPEQLVVTTEITADTESESPDVLASQWLDAMLADPEGGELPLAPC